MSGPVCRSCGSSRVKHVGRKRGEFLPREFDFHRCQDCTLLFVEPFSGFEIYDDAYYRGQGADPYVDYAAEYQDYRRTDRVLEFDDMARLATDFFRHPTQSNPPTSPSPTSPTQPIAWLDFGCGAGGFLKYLRSRGAFLGRPLELTGHDVGSYADLLRTVDGFRILDLAGLAAEPSQRYDVISMIEVIEHLPDPAAALTIIARLLKPGGLLLLTTGNLDCRMARRQGIQFRYCVPEIHVSLFNPRALNRLYERVGLTPRRVTYRGVVIFKVVKSLRHQRRARHLARLALRFPPFVRLVDGLYGVSAMPCAVKSGGQT